MANYVPIDHFGATSAGRRRRNCLLRIWIPACIMQVARDWSGHELSWHTGHVAAPRSNAEYLYIWAI